MFTYFFQRGSKGEIVNAMIKVEFGDKTLGESPKLDCSPDNPAEFNFSANLNCTYDDPMSMDEIAYKPVVRKSFNSYHCDIVL